MQVWAIIVDGFRESLDRKIFWVMIGISFLVTLAMLCVGFHADRVSFLFGMWDIETSLFNPATDVGRSAIASIAVISVDLIVGWVGIILALIATAGFFPSFMARGPVDLVVSKPISRPKLFIAKYLGTLVFMLVQSVFFVVPTFLVMGLRWGTWLPGYLYCIPLMILLFSYLYCISVWSAVWTRSSMVAIFVSLGAWFVFFGIQQADNAFEMVPEWKKHRSAYAVVHAVKWIVPKTQDITYFAERWSGAAPSDTLMTPPPDPSGADIFERVADLDRILRKQDVASSIGSSLVFEAVVLGCAMWLFCRRDF